MPDHPNLDPDISRHYASGSEIERLVEDRVEEIRTWELLGRFLPATPATLVDVGGGPGSYAVGLTQQGYRVHLVDPVELHISQAKQRAKSAEAKLASASVGDARSLEFADASADAVLLFGPLYHLTEYLDRVTCLREAARIVVPHGRIMAAGISRYASTFDALRSRLLSHPDFETIIEGDVSEGRHTNLGNEEWFTTAYFHEPQEMVTEFNEAGITVDEILAVEGPASWITGIDDWYDDEVMRERLLRAIRRVESAQSLIGASAHFMVIGHT